MKSQIIKILKIVVPLGIGIYLTWYFFSDLSDREIEQTKSAFYEANYFWIFLSLLVAFLGHLSRAYRWLFLLRALGYKPSLKNAYNAVMSGYVINYTVPRSGEVARAGLMSTYEKIPFEKGFATIVIERVIDVIMLGGIVFITTIVQTNSEEFRQIMEAGEKDESNLKWYILGGGALLGIIGFTVYMIHKGIRKWVNEKVKGFWEGLKSIWKMDKKWAFIFHTVFIWVTYIAMIWFSALAFPETKSMPVGALLGAFVVGATAIALFPGGIGAYPLWITEVLLIYEIDFKGFGMFVWVVQTAFIVLLGLLSLFLIQRQPKPEPTEQ